MPTNGSQNNDRDPWRRAGGNEPGPPDLLELWRQFKNKFNQKKGQTAKDSNRSWILGIVAVVVVLWGLSGIFVVDPAEQAVVLRLGQYHATVDSGPHWIPRFVDTEYTRNIQRIDSFPYESEMLTKDENIVSVSVQVQYRIADLRDYLFDVVDPVTTLHQATSSVLRQVVGQMSLDDILTTGRENLTQEVSQQLKETLIQYKTGLEVRDVALQSTKPPEAVTAAFDDVVKAREDRQRFINQAQAYAKRIVLTAQGQVARLQQEADAYNYSVVADAKGATARYLALLTPYQNAPGVTRERLYLDMLSQVLARTNNVVVGGGNNNLLYVPLQQLLSAQSTAPTSSAASVNTNSDQSPAATDTSSNGAGNNTPGANRPSYANPPTTGGSY